MVRALPPIELLTDLLRDARVGVAPVPNFAWVVRASGDGARQRAWQVVVGTDSAAVATGRGTLWDSQRVTGPVSHGVAYAGRPLPTDRDVWWSVRVWCGAQPSPWAVPVPFRVDPETFARPEAPGLHRERAVHLEDLGDGTWMADFGRATFATPVLDLGRDGTVTIHAGERRLRGRVDRSPPGTIRCSSLTIDLSARDPVVVTLPPNHRNTTHPSAVHVPAPLPEVVPFRWLEIEGLDAEPAAGAVARDTLRVPCDRSVATFTCDEPDLERVWRLCADTVDATTFLGVFVDGDRERIAYEGDAWINQLSHRALDRTPATTRATIAHLLRLPTWPTEWQLHFPLMAWEDWWWTGDARALERWRDDLAVRTLTELDRGDGLITTRGTVTPDLLKRLRLDRLEDLVDWPPGSFTAGGTGERDGHEMPAVNTVVNAFYAEACRAMAAIDTALGRHRDAAVWTKRSRRTTRAINTLFWNDKHGAYVDGEGSRHPAQHSTLFPLAFGLVPAKRVARALDHVISRGMACSVYAAQHLLDGLYRHGRADAALDLMLARHDRSWLRMLEVGSTMTLEAWDWRYKNNLDWNHAWATAPLNVCARWILGVQPAAAGCAQLAVHPQPGRLRTVAGRVPTMRGTVAVTLSHEPGVRCEATLELPANATAVWSVPWTGSARVWLDGVPLPKPRAVAGRLHLGEVGSGRHQVRVERP